MATYKTISSQVVIGRIYRLLKLTGNDYIDSFIEWIGEALEHIGNGSNIIHKAAVLEVKGHKALLPCDLYYIDMVGGTTNKTNIFISNPNWDGYARETAFAAIFPTSQPLAYGSRIFNASVHAEGAPNQYITSSDTYITDGCYIKTSFKEGQVTLLYTAFETDEQGFPTVPDDISFKEACFWYCFKMMLLSGHQHPEFNFDKADAKWQQYCTQARNAHNMMDVPMASSFLNQWVRLAPAPNLTSSWLNTLQDPENLIR